MSTTEPGSFRLPRLLALLAAMALLAAACGGGDDSADDDADSEASASAADTTEAATDTDDDDAAEESTSSGDAVEVRWFVGLGTGAQEEQIERQDAVVDAFNDSQGDIELVVEYIDNSTAADVLATQIAAGNAPDIIGPVGLEGSNAFAGQYADLEPLIAESGFDLSPFAGSEEVYRTAEGALEGIPFATFPSGIFYNKDLFDEAGLPYPPASYEADGSSVYGEGTEFEGPWDYEKLAEIAAILSVDTNGNDAASGAYDKAAIEQFGFAHQWTTNPTSLGTSFGAGRLEQTDGSAEFPDAWVESYKWYHNLVHEVGAAPNQTQTDSDLLAGNVFNSGNVAMVSTHLWYTCCIADLGDTWDIGALPTHDGTLVSKLHGDTFRIHKDSADPQAAFTVLEYFFDDAALDLLDVYGGMPARPDIRDSYFASLDEQFPQGVNWDVIIAGLEYADSPNHQTSMPSFLEADARVKEFETPLLDDPDFDIDAGIAEVEADLTALWAG
ncbi:MAG: extracellular solute-binding protein [Actinomycetota bacterium]